jgi:hypothetical protein
VNLKIADLELHESLPPRYGCLAGRRAYTPLGTNKDKTKKLSMSNVFVRDDDLPAMIVDDPDDPWSTCKLLDMWIVKALPPSWQGFIFLHQAPGKVIKKREAAAQKLVQPGCPFPPVHLGYTDFRPSNGAGVLVPKGKIGVNYPNVLFKALARRCHFVNPDHFTGRAARRSGVSKMVNANVPQGIITEMSRHACDSTNAIYQEFTSETYQGALTSTHYSVQQGMLFVCFYFYNFSISYHLFLFLPERRGVKSTYPHMLLFSCSIKCASVTHCFFLTAPTDQNEDQKPAATTTNPYLRREQEGCNKENLPPPNPFAASAVAVPFAASAASAASSAPMVTPFPSASATVDFRQIAHPHTVATAAPPPQQQWYSAPPPPQPQQQWYSAPPPPQQQQQWYSAPPPPQQQQWYGAPPAATATTTTIFCGSSPTAMAACSCSTTTVGEYSSGATAFCTSATIFGLPSSPSPSHPLLPFSWAPPSSCSSGQFASAKHDLWSWAAFSCCCSF